MYKTSINKFAKCEILTKFILQIAVLGDATPCSLVKNTGVSKDHSIAALLTAVAGLTATSVHANKANWHTSQIQQSV
jgi:hypothetical protein